LILRRVVYHVMNAVKAKRKMSQDNFMTVTRAVCA